METHTDCACRMCSLLPKAIYEEEESLEISTSEILGAFKEEGTEGDFISVTYRDGRVFNRFNNWGMTP